MGMNVPTDEILYFQLNFIFVTMLYFGGFLLSAIYLIWELIHRISSKGKIKSIITDGKNIKTKPEDKNMNNRSVLVIDTPKTCEECILNKDNTLCYVTGSLYTDTTDFDCTQGRLRDCPLRCLPER